MRGSEFQEKLETQSQATVFNGEGGANLTFVSAPSRYGYKNMNSCVGYTVG